MAKAKSARKFEPVKMIAWFMEFMQGVMEEMRKIDPEEIGPALKHMAQQDALGVKRRYRMIARHVLGGHRIPVGVEHKQVYALCNLIRRYCVGKGKIYESLARVMIWLIGETDYLTKNVHVDIPHTHDLHCIFALLEKDEMQHFLRELEGLLGFHFDVYASHPKQPGDTHTRLWMSLANIAWPDNSECNVLDEADIAGISLEARIIPEN